MPTLMEWPNLPFFEDSLLNLRDVDAMPLMLDWGQTIVEGNRRGVLAGVDGNNVPMPALKYRNGKGRKTRNRQSPAYGKSYKTTPIVEGIEGPFSAGFDANLTTAQYQELTGPRLAPRRDQSRVITQLHIIINRDPGGQWWEVLGVWADVVSKKGYPFLKAHFEGLGRNPQYDLRPIRPEDVQFCVNSLQAFTRQIMHERF